MSTLDEGANAKVPATKLEAPLRIRPKLAEALETSADGRLRKGFVYLELWLTPSDKDVLVSVNGNFAVGEFVHPLDPALFQRLYAWFHAKPPERPELRCLIGLRNAIIQLELSDLETAESGFAVDLTAPYAFDQKIELERAIAVNWGGAKLNLDLSAKLTDKPDVGADAKAEIPLTKACSENVNVKRNYEAKGASFVAQASGSPRRPEWSFANSLPFKSDCSPSAPMRQIG